MKLAIVNFVFLSCAVCCISWRVPTKLRIISSVQKFSSYSKLPKSITKLNNSKEVQNDNTRENAALAEQFSKFCWSKIAISKSFLSNFSGRTFFKELLQVQTVLVLVSLLSSFFTQYPTGLEYISFDSLSMKTSLILFAVATCGRFIFEYLPFKVSKDLKKNNKDTILNKVGKETSILNTFLLCFQLACEFYTQLISSFYIHSFMHLYVHLLINVIGISAFSEELFFRGLVFNTIQNYSNDFFALVMSSALFGLIKASIETADTIGYSIANALTGFYYYSLGITNFVLKFILGMILGVSYLYSDYNLAVPMAIHAMYDFSTFFFTWFFTKYELSIKKNF